jgi:hypothetical protein
MISNFVQHLDSSEPVIDKSAGFLFELKKKSLTPLKGSDLEPFHYEVPLEFSDKTHENVKRNIHEGSIMKEFWNFNARLASSMKTSSKK